MPGRPPATAPARRATGPRSRPRGWPGWWTRWWRRWRRRRRSRWWDTPPRGTRPRRWPAGLDPPGLLDVISVLGEPLERAGELARPVHAQELGRHARSAGPWTPRCGSPASPTGPVGRWLSGRKWSVDPAV